MMEHKTMSNHSTKLYNFGGVGLRYKIRHRPYNNQIKKLIFPPSNSQNSFKHYHWVRPDNTGPVTFYPELQGCNKCKMR